MKRSILFILLVTVFTLNGSAQKSSGLTKSQKALKSYNLSEGFVIRRQYKQALELLKDAVKRDSKFAEAHLRLGTVYKSIGQPEQALQHFERAVNLKPNDPFFIGGYFSLAEHFFSLNNFEEARDYLAKIYSKKPKDPRILNDINRLRDNINFASENIHKPLPFNPKPLPDYINKFSFQNFPVLTADQQTLIFTRLYSYDPQHDEDIYISKKVPAPDAPGETVWSEPVSISPKINTKSNEGTCTISADGKMLIFTSCQGRKSFGSCDLYVTYKKGELWSEPQNIGPKINSSSWESQPSLSADGRTLYFISNRPGGSGKRDIWVSEMNDNGEWEQAVNVGPEINTAEDEVSPFIHVNGQTLYFASKGYPGFGGFDLYVIEKKGTGWSTPENLGYPLNNYDDQLSLFITSDGQKGYYSHEKKNGNNYHSSHIYEFEVPEEIKVTNKSNYVAGKVFDAETEKLLDAQIELFDITKDQLVSRVTSDPVNGEYLMVITEGAEYALFITRPDYLFESLNFNYSDQSSNEPVKIDIFLKPIKSGGKAILQNIFFDSDKFDLKEKSKTELKKVVKFLQANPELKVEIAGYTDDQGSADYNRSLSLNRAKAVYDYLNQEGISDDQLTFKGYGQSDPVAPNDSEENRQKNRRIEFKLLKTS